MMDGGAAASPLSWRSAGAMPGETGLGGSQRLSSGDGAAVAWVRLDAALESLSDELVAAETVSARVAARAAAAAAAGRLGEL
jgi:hypothetical protein